MRFISAPPGLQPRVSASVHTFQRLPALIHAIREGLDEVDTISFDIFDTLLIRRNHHPDDLKWATARYLARRAKAAGRPWSRDRIQRLRNKVEAMHRRRAGRTHPDREACYPAFMADTLRIIFREAADEALLREVTDYELGIESAFLVARGDLLDLVRDLKAAGKQVLAISDMYLPATHLRLLLDRAGFTGLVDEVFSSADVLKAKASGAAWSRVQAAMDLEPARWLHVGDNPISDGTSPAQFGVRAMVLRDTAELHRYTLSRTYAECAEARPFWRGRLAQQWMLPLEKENAPVPELYAIGYQYFGPMLCAFIQHVAEQALAKGVKRVYFLSREGDILRDIWKKTIPSMYAGSDKIPTDHYLYVSRMALAGAACAHQGLSYAHALIAFLPATNRDFRDLCRVYNLDIAPLRPFLKKHGLAEDTPMSRWHPGWSRAHLVRLCQLTENDAEFQEEVRRQARPANDALQAYLTSEGFFEEGPVALVDIGWLGTIQRFLHEAIRHRPDAPALHGQVLACSGGYPFPYSEKNQLDGFFFDYKKFNFAGSLVLYAQELFEETTRAHHPGLMAYGPDPEKGFHLLFRDPDDPCSINEREQSAYFAPLQQGIRDAAERYAPAMAVLGYEAKEWKPWLNVQTVNRIAFPRTHEVEILTRIHHLDDFASTRDKPVRANRALLRLWNRPLWQLRWWPWIRPYHYLKHAVHWLRT